MSARKVQRTLTVIVFVLGMDLFQSTVLKNEYKEFVDKIMPNVLLRGLCHLTCCKWHNKFTIECNLCREARCSYCLCFNVSLNFLLNNVNEQGKKYIHNFVYDFLKMSDESMQRYNIIHNVKKVKRVTFAECSFKNQGGDQIVPSDQQECSGASAPTRTCCLHFRNRKRKIRY